MIKTTSPPELTGQQIESIRNEAIEAGVVDTYDDLIAGGNSPRMAVMLAMRKCPGTHGTDAVFTKLERERMATIDDESMGRILKAARSAGINPHGKTYNGQLGRYDDPKAWVSDTHDVRVTARDKGLSIRGQVNAENPAKPIQRKKLADHLVRESIQEQVEADPALGEKIRKNPKAAAELKEKVIENHGNRRSRANQ